MRISAKSVVSRILTGPTRRVRGIKRRLESQTHELIVPCGIDKINEGNDRCVVDNKQVEYSSSPLWYDLCSMDQLSCKITLQSGQVFTWCATNQQNEWIGVIGNHVYKLRNHKHKVQFCCIYPPVLTITQAQEVLQDYFRLEVDSVSLYQGWTIPKDNMSKIISHLQGLRIIRQDPVECLFSFICSSNNNIPRITQMINKLKAKYGQLLVNTSDGCFYSFPSIEVLSKVDETDLRAIGFGYRAPFIIQTSILLQEMGGQTFLQSLRDCNDDDKVIKQLLNFKGVGPKVADCIALFSLDKLDTIPVDTHVWQIACREFDPTLTSKKSITPAVYKTVGDHFRSRFKPYAGWAHSVLFAGDLKPFALKKNKKQKS